jgi:hypothetical protein
MKFYFEQPEGEWVEQGEAHLHIRFRPRNALGVILALLAHLLVLWLALHHHREKIKIGGSPGNPIVLILDDKTLKQIAKAAEPKKVTPKPVHVPKTQPRVNPKPAPVPAPDIPSPLQPVQPEQAKAPAKDQVPDMMARIEQRRAQRQALEDQAKDENEAARQGERRPSAQELAEANVKRSMQNAYSDGTSGVFEIKSKSVREATFVFNGWKNSASNRLHRVITVDAGLNGDIDLAIVRRMIELIRDYYTGDFYWDSRRLGRAVKMSARPKDQAELENFLMHEFNFK